MAQSLGEHCEIFMKDGNYFVKDNGSTHGTIVRNPWSLEIEHLGT